MEVVAFAKVGLELNYGDTGDIELVPISKTNKLGKFSYKGPWRPSWTHYENCLREKFNRKLESAALYSGQCLFINSIDELFSINFEQYYDPHEEEICILSEDELDVCGLVKLGIFINSDYYEDYLFPGIEMEIGFDWLPEAINEYGLFKDVAYARKFARIYSQTENTYQHFEQMGEIENLRYVIMYSIDLELR